MKQITILLSLFILMACNNTPVEYEEFPYPETLEVNGFIYRNWGYSYVLREYPQDINVESIRKDKQVVDALLKNVKAQYPNCQLEFSSISTLTRFYVFDVYKERTTKNERPMMKRKALDILQQ